MFSPQVKNVRNACDALDYFNTSQSPPQIAPELLGFLSAPYGSYRFELHLAKAGDMRRLKLLDATGFKSCLPLEMLIKTGHESVVKRWLNQQESIEPKAVKQIVRGAIIRNKIGLLEWCYTWYRATALVSVDAPTFPSEAWLLAVVNEELEVLQWLIDKDISISADHNLILARAIGQDDVLTMVIKAGVIYTEPFVEEECAIILDRLGCTIEKWSEDNICPLSLAWLKENGVDLLCTEWLRREYSFSEWLRREYSFSE